MLPIIKLKTLKPGPNNLVLKQFIQNSTSIRILTNNKLTNKLTYRLTNRLTNKFHEKTMKLGLYLIYVYCQLNGL